MPEAKQYSYHNIFETFDSSEHGLDSNEAIFRLKKYGQNHLGSIKKKSAWIQFLEEFYDPMVLLLIAATVFAFFSGDTVDALIIFLVVILNAAISFIQKHRAEKAVEALKKLVSPQARVIRNHQQILVDTANLVPGDIIMVNEGDTVPADAIIFQANELESAEAVLRGESMPIPKTAFDTTEKGAMSTVDNIIFTGATISRGNAKALVIKTGLETEFGKIATMTQETKKDATPLEKEIHRIGIFAAQITLIIIAIIFIFELLVHQRSILDNILFSASIAVAAVPEGLPAVITIALALGVQRLSKKNAIIRQLSAVETLGATTVICTDKTGTLTKNEMTVTQAVIDDFYLQMEGVGYEPKGSYKIITGKNEQLEILDNQISNEFSRQNPGITSSLNWLNLCATLCNNAALTFKDNRYQVLGDPTEGCLKTLALKIDQNLEENVLGNWEEIHELPFDSDRKMMSKIYLDRKHGKYYVFLKGAPEQVLAASDQRLHHGRATILTKGIKEDLMHTNEQFNQKALRTIALAYKEINVHDINEFLQQSNFQGKTHQLEKKLTFIGIVGLTDPPRIGVKEAIKMTSIAGIRTIIITGDNGLTAEAIAEQIGLSSPKRPATIITGEQLARLTDQELKDILSKKDSRLIFARTKPEHKLRIVSILKENGEIVAVTGDGVNDAPALKRADIGVAMGLTGSDVSREAASLVLMDDSFKTIVVAIEEGRVIFSNLKKFIFYIFSSNVGEVVAIFFSLIIGLGAPLSAMLILTINFVTDLFPALALSFEPAEKHLMQQAPRSPKEKIMSGKFVQRIMITGFALGFITLALYAYKLFYNGWAYGTPIPDELLSQASSLAFVALVILQVANSFNAKTENVSLFVTNPFNNWKLILANLSSALIAIAIVEIPFLQRFFHTSGLNLLDWGLVAISCVLITIVSELIKFTNRKNKKNHEHHPKTS